MSVKEIRELEDAVREVETSGSRESVDGSREEGSSWAERDFVGDEEEGREEGGDEEEFSIGDTMLARGDAKEVWGGGLEEELEGDVLFGHDSGEPDFDSGFGDEFSHRDDLFGPDDEGGDFGGEEGFSYETMGQSGGSDLYGAGAGSGGGDLYGVGGSGSGMDLYGAPGGKGSDSVSMYNTSGNSDGESSMYNVAGSSGKKSVMGSVYQVEGGSSRGRRSQVAGRRKGKGSGLEGGVGRKRRSKGASIL